MESLKRTYTDGAQIFEVDTESDEYAIVIGERTMTHDDAERWYRDHRNDDV